MRRIVILFTVLSLLAGVVATAQTRDRGTIPEKHTWNLADLYPSDAAWRESKERLVARIGGFAEFKGTLSSSPARLLAALDYASDLRKEFLRLYSYAGMASDQDTRVSAYQAMKQEMAQVGATLAAATSFLEPEILAIDRSTVDAFLEKEPKLRVYAHPLDDILRRKAHTLSPAEEKIIADAGLMADAPDSIYSIFADGDFPFPKVTLSDGREIVVDKANFGLYRAVPDRADRKLVFDAYFDALGRYRATFGAMLNGQVNRDIFYMKARGYGSSLESSLDRNAIPTSVYMAHLANVEKSLPTFHRYLQIRKRLLGVDELRYHDLYAPLLGDVDLDYPVEKAQPVILASLAPLGKEYQSIVKRSFDERWIDLYPSEGKRSGAYSNGAAYDVHPYMLLNYNGKYEDITTLTHELGHTMQSWLSNRKQPFATADYPIFVAEVASTFNEALLIDHLLGTIRDDRTRLALLGSYIDNIRLTVFRQTQFADFELKMHEMAERGEPLTGDSLGRLYLDVVRKYYGHDAGVTVVADNVQHEWMHIPHFYYNFYVYQYATAFTASAALSEKVLAGDRKATARYLDFLSAGGSNYPIALLQTAGVDMTSSEPLDLTMKKMNRIMDEMEAILARMEMKQATRQE
jgi:oligoendopeptidase F